MLRNPTPDLARKRAHSNSFRPKPDHPAFHIHPTSSDTMNTRTQSLKLLLTLLLIVPSTPRLAQAHCYQPPSYPEQTPSRPGFSFGAYMGMTFSEVSALYRSWEGARGWRAEPAVRSNGHTTQLVGWTFSSAPESTMFFIIKDGFVATFQTSEPDPTGSRFASTESLLNRKLEAINAHQWFDMASKSAWMLSRENGNVSLFISTTFSK